jgi:hypothetical protein
MSLYVWQFNEWGQLGKRIITTSQGLMEFTEKSWWQMVSTCDANGSKVHMQEWLAG